jgi:hypothetical protein
MDCVKFRGFVISVFQLNCRFLLMSNFRLHGVIPPLPTHIRGCRDLLLPYGISEVEYPHFLSTDKYELYLVNVTRLVPTAIPEDGDRDSFRNVV